eukprot:2041571-Pyramimonas_sp.AAC.2
MAVPPTADPTITMRGAWAEATPDCGPGWGVGIEARDPPDCVTCIMYVPMQIYHRGVILACVRV